jgi:predicted DNA-binding protein YlxM (UPF0122 family)
MLTELQQHRFSLYQEFRSLAKVAEREGVSRERIRQTLESLPPDSLEYQEYKAIAEAEKGGRPRQYANLQEQRRVNMRNWRARQKQQADDNS